VEKYIKLSPQSVQKAGRVCKFVKKRRAGFIGCSSRYTVNTGGSTCNSADMGIFKRMACRFMGSDHRKSRRHIIKGLLYDTSGDAAVEATILFPIMIMIFAALVLLSIYLPARAVLQRATQYAATALATEISDTWLFFDEGRMSYYRHTDKKQLKNVYEDLFTKSNDAQNKGEIITAKIESQSISSKSGQLSIESDVINNIFYKEVVVTATREFPMPVDLSFVGFPGTIKVTASSTAVVQNGEEFVRNIDMANDFVEFIADKYNLHDITNAISSFGNRITGLLGW